MEKGIIYEGPDGIGKTTLVKSKISNYTKREHKSKTLTTALMNDLWNARKYKVMDRSNLISTYVYTFNKKNNRYFKFLIKQLLKRWDVIILIDSKEKLIVRLMARGDVNLEFILKNIDTLLERYSDVIRLKGVKTQNIIEKK